MDDEEGNRDQIQNITNEEWELIGRDFSNNEHLWQLRLSNGAFDDDKLSCFFRGFTGSNSLRHFMLTDNEFGVAGLRSMVPFLQSSNLKSLTLIRSNIKSEGFDMLVRALRDNPIGDISCNYCGIESIDIDPQNFPKQLESLGLSGNNMKRSGYRALAHFLQGDSTLKELRLHCCNIDDDDVAFFVDALQQNTSLETLSMILNNDISTKGLAMCLKLVNDISSVSATFQSNHTLKELFVHHVNYDDLSVADKKIQLEINSATSINWRMFRKPEAAGAEKLIKTQLNSVKRSVLAGIQGCNKPLNYSDIDPLHLPEVLALIGRRHGQRELYMAFISSVAGVISIVNKRRFLKEKLAHHLSKVGDIRAKLAELDEAEGIAMNVSDENCSNKRRRN